MPLIVDLPEEPVFTIKKVSLQTGIRPVTLRAWERRYEVLDPHRASNRYRLYSERDVAILRWLKSRIDDGISVSNAVNELRSMASANNWPEAIPQAPVPVKKAGNIPPSEYARQVFQALIKHDENHCGELLRDVHSQFDLLAVCMEILVPALRQIGEAWYHGEIRVTTEHFASAYLRGKLLTLLQTYPSRRSSPLILIGCAPMEQHELGSLMLAVLLRSEGYRVEFLGPDLPIEDLADYASYEHPALVILSATSEDSAHAMMRMQDLLQQPRLTPIFGYGGRAFDLLPHLRSEIPGIYLGSTLEAAQTSIRDLLKNRQGNRD